MGKEKRGRLCPLPSDKIKVKKCSNSIKVNLSSKETKYMYKHNVNAVITEGNRRAVNQLEEKVSNEKILIKGLFSLKVIHFFTLPSSCSSFREMTT